MAFLFCPVSTGSDNCSQGFVHLKYYQGLIKKNNSGASNNEKEK